MTELPPGAEAVLREGRLCYLAADTSAGVHLTPVVFVLHEGSLYATTRRGAVKARAWRRNPATAGLVRLGDRAVSFRGMVTLHDLLDPGTWAAGLLRAPALLRASVAYTRKNAPYFAGYARDARQIPLSWTPPARVVASIDLESVALLDLAAGRVEAATGWWPDVATGLGSFASGPRRPGADRGLPEGLRELVARPGEGALGISGAAGPAVLPVRWVRAASEGAFYAHLPQAFADLSGADGAGEAALVADRASRWRASKMRGVLLPGPAEVFLPGTLAQGRDALVRKLRRAGGFTEPAAGVRLVPTRAVWWHGWTSGTVGAP